MTMHATHTPTGRYFEPEQGSPIPRIETERLVLRAHLASDFEPYAEFFASDRAKYMGRLTRRQAWDSFCSDIAQWSLFGFGAWGLQDRATGAFVGQVAVIQPDHFPEPELGWFMLPEAEGRSLAFEAARAARDWAFGARGLETLVSYIDPANARSAALAERLGALPDAAAKRPEGESEEETRVWRHPAPVDRATTAGPAHSRIAERSADV